MSKFKLNDVRLMEQQSPDGWKNTGNWHDVFPVNGVYVLRDQNKNILFIDSVGSRRLRDRLIGHLQINDVSRVRYLEMVSGGSMK